MLFVLLAAFFAGPLLAAQLPSQTAAPDPILKQAIDFHQAGDIASAIPLYQKYIAGHPGSMMAHSNLGAALASVGRFREAITQYRQALRLQPTNTAVELNLGLAYYKSNQADEAAAVFSKVHRAVPEQLQPALLLADCWLQLGENKKVVDLLTPLYAARPDEMAIVYMLGTALVRDEQIEKGQVLIDRILSKGDSAEARLLMGTTRLQAQEYPAALADLAKAVELNPSLPEVYGYYAQALLRTGDPAGAADAFRKALTDNPNDFMSTLQMAILLKEEEKLEEARRLLRHALELRPGDVAVRYQLATIDLKDEHALEATRRQLEKIVKESPAYTAAHVTLATVYYRLKRKTDGDRERAIVQKLNAEAQALQQKGVNVK